MPKINDRVGLLTSSYQIYGIAGDQIGKGGPVLVGVRFYHYTDQNHKAALTRAYDNGQSSDIFQPTLAKNLCP